jgi:FkbM family methyltransferase
MGLGADKIIKVCEEKGVEISDFFASDGFVRGHSFHGKVVLSYSEAKEKYGNFIVLLSFASSLPDVIELIKKVASEMELYAPDVPVAGDEIFDYEYYSMNKSSFDEARNLFEDEYSKAVFDDVINYKLTGDIKYLFYHTVTAEEVYKNLLKCEKYKKCGDMGGYNGDSVKEFVKYFPNVERIISFEPDAKNFAKLKKYGEENCPDICEPYNYAAWNVCEKQQFNRQSSRNSGIGGTSHTGKTVEIECRPLDWVLNGRMLDYIKYDVEGAEEKALIGSENVISEFVPDLLVSAYHRSSDLFVLPKLIKQLNSKYKLYLRRFTYIPAWDLNIYAVHE